MHGARITFPLAVLLAACTGCGRDGPHSTPSLTLDQTGYVTRLVAPNTVYRQFTVIATTANRDVDAVIIPLCAGTPFYSMEPVDSDADSGYSPAYGCETQTTQFTLAPGASRVDTIVVRGPTSTNGYTGEAIGLLQGRFIMMFATDHGLARSRPVLVR